MASNLYPLKFKPGIKRDGTPNQSEYCTDGQWVRFQRGFVKKIGGMRGIVFNNFSSTVTDLRIVSSGTISGGRDIFIYQADSEASIYKFGLSSLFTVDPTTEVLYGPHSGWTELIWQSEIITQGNISYLTYLGAQTRSDIYNNGWGSLLLYISIPNAPGTKLTAFANPPYLQGVNGLLFASNYLFVYGGKGLVQWSKPNNPLDFTNPTSRQQYIGSDTIIYAKSIRGGLNNPAILFWTSASVIRCVNASTTGDIIAFSPDVLSNGSGPLSSRCIVEYDGFFYWPGLNRFFIYNGVVRELPNTMSLNFFFNNIDMKYRQQVFGVKNAQYGEIWWFYPERIGTPGRMPFPSGANTRVLIYNIREQTWYDTAISRNAGFYSELFGFMCTQGVPLTNTSISNCYTFRHEVDTLYPEPTSDEILLHTGRFPIPSNFTTPMISWASFNPMEQFTGVNRWLYLITIEPDFTLMPTLAQGGTDMRFVINTKQYAQDFPLSSPSYPVPVPLISGQDSSLAKIDTAWQGRYISLTFTTTANFEMGQTILQLGIGDGQ